MSSRKKRPRETYYAVKEGKVPGIYRTWAEAKAMVYGFSGAVHKLFGSREEAEAFIADDALAPPPSKRLKTSETEVEVEAEASTSERTLIIYTDGACKGNNIKDESKRRGGIGIYAPMINLEVSRRLPTVFHSIHIKTSNNSAELFAILEAIFKVGYLASQGLLGDYDTILFRSDSSNAIGICLGIYKGEKMASLAKLIRSAIRLFESKHKLALRFKWVRGHGTDLGNIRADELANRGCLMEEDDV